MRRAVAAGLLALLLVQGCGVPEDDAPRALTPREVPFASPTDSPPAEQVGDREVELGFVRDERVVLSSRAVEDPRTPEQVLELLFAGPSEAEKAEGLSTFLPSTVTVEDVTVVGDTAVVSLDGLDDSEVLRLAPLAYAQIVATLTPERVAGVRFRLDGTDLRVPREDSTLTTEPLSRRDYPGLVSAAGDATPPA